MNSFGQIIATARRAKGLTQEELAKKAGITQAALSRYEAGLRHPDDESLANLADALGVTPALISSGGRVLGAIATGAHMRRRRTARPTLWKTTEAELMMALLHSSLLFDRVQTHAHNSVPHLDLSESTPAQCARTVRMQWRMPSGPVSQLISWLESAGILVFEKDFGLDAKVDGLSTSNEGTSVVLINSAVPTDRKRWTLAHELGHLVMHTEEIYSEENVEKEANEFAAEFLMPEVEVKAMLSRLETSNLLTYKQYWGTSMAAIVERAHGLGLLSAQERTGFYKRMSALGYRKNEPGSDAIPTETPVFPSRVADELFSIGLSETEVSQLVGFASAEENELFVRSAPSRRLRVVS